VTDPYQGEEHADRSLPDFNGPYKESFGKCAFGHPVNGFGRCEELNSEPPTCPPAESQE